MFDVFVAYWWQFLIVIVLSYTVGAVNFAVIFSKIFKKADIRDYGSGNPGTTNVYRVFGFKLGILTLAFDILKGVVCCLAAMFALKICGDAASFTAASLAGLFAVVGHVFPVFYKFRGGKGFATALGATAVLHPVLLLCCILPICLIIAVTDRMSVAGILWALFMIIWTWAVWLNDIGAFCAAVITLMFAILIFAHRHNIVRLLKGKELPTGIRKAIFSKKDKKEKDLSETENAQSDVSNQSSTQTDDSE